MRARSGRDDAKPHFAASVMTPRLDLTWLDHATLARLVEGDRRSAERGVAAVFPDAWVDEWRGLLHLRLDQWDRDPRHGPWLIRAVVLRSSGVAIGQVGFHGAPG